MRPLGAVPDSGRVIGLQQWPRVTPVTGSRSLAGDSQSDHEPLTEPSSVRTRTLGHWLVPPGLGGTWATLLLLVVLCGSVLAASGVGVAQLSRILVVLVVQVATGAVLWRLARGSTSSHISELVGMGLALGTLTALLSAQVLLPTPLAGIAWLLPTVAVAASLAVPKVRRRLRSGSTVPVSADEAGTVALGIGIGVVFVWSFWQQHPLRWDGWWKYYVDIPYHEALATSLATWGPKGSIVAVGGADPLSLVRTCVGGHDDERLTRRLVRGHHPDLAAGRACRHDCLTWAWSRRLSELRSVPFLAVLVVTLGMDVGRSQLPVAFLRNLTVSPSMAIAALWLLGAALVLTEHLAGRLTRPEPLLFLLAVGCVGGKVSDGVVLAGGVGVALVSLISRTNRKKVWIDPAVVTVAVGAAFVVLIAGNEGNLVVELGSVGGGRPMGGGRLGMDQDANLVAVRAARVRHRHNGDPAPQQAGRRRAGEWLSAVSLRASQRLPGCRPPVWRRTWRSPRRAAKRGCPTSRRWRRRR